VTGTQPKNGQAPKAGELICCAHFGADRTGEQPRRSVFTDGSLGVSENRFHNHDLKTSVRRCLKDMSHPVNDPIADRGIAPRILLWTARVWSLLAVGLVLLFAIGEGMSRPAAVGRAACSAS
jgi:hypothetical protein